ncbi:remorin 1.4 isoform X1 [Citrus sinensis]|uniref:remorin 1.4 isoform X1 n=1 Tax=Citrus sinensis TaxID=2711 RepID=UPI00227805CA|nr:remorin 1.4 isoform X1 [Citrus sinensis]XP_024954125.2 remorin 1.4 isoform X1 [Citrus sinensis]XP_024954126.2 remorin 1.4 isoform X1 [Citrus sinensis]
MSHDNDPQESEYAAAVAAAAFSIYLAEEAEAQNRRNIRKELEVSRTKLKSRKEDSITRQPSSKDHKNRAGETSRSSAEVDRRAQESAFPVSRPSLSPSARSTAPQAMDQGLGIPPRHGNIEKKAEAWELAQMQKIIKRYEKLKAAVLTWEYEKKFQAKLKMEKRKAELDKKRTLNQQHYQNKIARIERIAGGARAQAEEERIKKEAEIKEKARMIRSREKAPVKYCLCC